MPEFPEDDLISFASFETANPPAAVAMSAPVPTLLVDLLDPSAGERQRTTSALPLSPNRVSFGSNYVKNEGRSPGRENMAASTRPDSARKDSFADVLKLAAKRAFTPRPYSPKTLPPVTGAAGFASHDDSKNGPKSRRRESSVLANVSPMENYLCSSAPVSPMPVPSLHEVMLSISHQEPKSFHQAPGPTSMLGQEDNVVDHSGEDDEKKMDEIMLRLKAVADEALADEVNGVPSASANPPSPSPSPPPQPVRPPPGLAANQGKYIYDESFLEPSTSPQDVRWLQPEEDSVGPIVHLTLPVYNSMVANEAKIKETMKSANEKHEQELREIHLQLANVKSQLSKRQDSPTSQEDNGSPISQDDNCMAVLVQMKEDEIRQLRAQLEAERLQSSRHSQALQSDQSKRPKTTRNDYEIQKAARKAEILVKKDQEMAALQSKLDAAEQNGELIKTLKEENDRLRGALEDAEKAAKQKAPVEELVQCQKQIQGLKEKLATEEKKSEHLTQQLKQMSRTPAAAKKIAELEEKVKVKTAEASRLRNDVREANKALEVKDAIIQKAGDSSKVLRGAAHFVQANGNARLPKTVFSCVECYVNNITCDSKPTCVNCSEKREKCYRFRCSQRHVLKECVDKPCTLKHDSQGWLMTAQERPQW